MNNVILVGRITRDIELRYTTTGLACVSMSIAIDNGKDENGNKKKADFPKVYVYGKQAENVAKYCHKGSVVGVSGKLKTREWEQGDGKRYETYVYANKVQFLDTKKQENVVQEDKTNCEIIREAYEDPLVNFGDQIEFDEDLPFD